MIQTSIQAAKLFVSYGRLEDDEFVRKLCDRLVATGFTVWRDVSDLPNRGLSFPAELIVAIRENDRLVFVVGPKSVGSSWCESEWQHGLEEGKPVHPVLRSGDMGIVPADLRLFDVRDFRRSELFEAEFKRLVEQLAEPIVPAGKLVAVPLLPPYHLPNLERLRQLRELFLADHRRPGVQSGVRRVLGLHGMSGSGKSLLAAALVKDYQIRRAHHDGIYWINVGQKPDVVLLQQDLARLLDCRKTSFRDIQEGRFFLSASLNDKEALLVLDDVWHADVLLAFDCLGPRCRLLVTTQDRELVTHRAGQEFPVNLPSLIEARALLARCAGCAEAVLPVEAEIILRECGNLPLAVSICGGRVASGAAWADVLNGLQASDPRFLEGPEHSVFRSIGSAILGLSQGEQNRFGELAALFLEEPVPDSVAFLLWEQTAGMTPAGGADLLRVLANHYLIIRQPARLPDREASFVVHALVRLCLEHLYPNPVPVHSALVEACRVRCEGQWELLVNSPYLHRHLSSHMTRANRWKDLADLAFGGSFELFQRWTERGEWAAGEECMRCILKGLSASKKHRWRYAAVATQLARVRQLQGDFTGARALLRSALSTVPFGRGVRTRLIAWHERGNLELACGKPGMATVFYLRKLLWSLLRPGENADEIRGALCGLAAAQRNRYAWRKALFIGRTVLLLARRSGDRCAEVQALTMTASALKSIGRYREAEGCFSEARGLAKAAERQLELSHLLTQWGWMAYDQATLASEPPRQATQFFRESKEAAERTGSYSLMADALNGLAWSCLVSGNLTEAQNCFTHAGSLLRGAWFSDISDGVRLGEIALHFATGELELVHSQLQALVLDCRRRGEMLWRAQACVGLGACQSNLGQPDTAARTWKEAESCSRRISRAKLEIIRASIAFCQKNVNAPPR